MTADVALCAVGAVAVVLLDINLNGLALIDLELTGDLIVESNRLIGAGKRSLELCDDLFQNGLHVSQELITLPVICHPLVS